MYLMALDYKLKNGYNGKLYIKYTLLLKENMPNSLMSILSFECKIPEY